MRTPRTPKAFKRKTRDLRGRHTKAERLAKIRSAKLSINIPTCVECNAVLDSAIRTEEGDAVVCTSCGVVDKNTCFDFEAPIYDFVPHSPFYMHKNYFAEKLLQSRNKEPSLSEKELDLLSIIFDIFKAKCPVLWSEQNFTKRHMGKICRFISKRYPKSPFCRRIERWFQYRTYICGRTGAELPEDVAIQLRYLFDAYSHFFLRDLEQNKKPKCNITQLDLVILVLLYNISPDYVNIYGWYFLNHNLVNKTPSIYSDRDHMRRICNKINREILYGYTAHIRPECYQWFRAGKKLKVPSVDSLLDMCLYSDLGTMQYASYKTKNDHGLYTYLNFQDHDIEMAIACNDELIKLEA